MQLSAEDSKPGYYLKFAGQFISIMRGVIGPDWTVAVPLSQATRFDAFATAEHARKLLEATSKAVRLHGGYSVEYVDGKMGCLVCAARVTSLFNLEGVPVCVHCREGLLWESEQQLHKRMELPEADHLQLHGMGVSW